MKMTLAEMLLIRFVKRCSEPGAESISARRCLELDWRDMKKKHYFKHQKPGHGKAALLAMLLVPARVQFGAYDLMTTLVSKTHDFGRYEISKQRS